MVDAHHAHQRQVLPGRGLQFGDVEQECRVTGQQHDRPLAALGDRGADGVGQTRAQMTEVLVPDHVARLGLRVGPLEDDGRAAVAHHDAVLGELVERLGRLDDVARRVHRGAPAWGALVGHPRQLGGVGLDQRLEVGRRRARGVPQRLDELRHDAAQIADQRHVERAG